MLWQLFTSFLKIGAFTIGGGYAMIPLIQDEVVTRRRWIEESEFLDMIAIAQSAPGVIAINTSIFVGYKLRGLPGAIVASLGSALPSFVIILVIASCFTQFKDNSIVARAFMGIRPTVVALIVAPVWRMGKTAGINWKTLWIPIVTALLIWRCGVSPILCVAVALLVGVIIEKIKKQD
ncbi:MAG TPA: chromate transporter [Bacteroidales bacterium]|nr:chromate transporter [Bacteroidales bacterium]